MPIALVALSALALEAKKGLEPFWFLISLSVLNHLIQVQVAPLERLGPLVKLELFVPSAMARLSQFQLMESVCVKMMVAMFHVSLFAHGNRQIRNLLDTALTQFGLAIMR
jgi:hypothetical protein